MKKNQISIKGLTSALACGLVLLGTAGCQKDLLDKQPLSSISDATFWRTANDATLAQLQKLTQGLVFGSESEEPLEAVSYAAPTGDLPDAQLLQVLGEPAGAKVEKVELIPFLSNHTNDQGVTGSVALANRFKALQMYLKQELDGVQVYRIGAGPKIHAYALGRDVAGRLAGFKTELTES